jgi:hypothetical protein
MKMKFLRQHSNGKLVRHAHQGAAGKKSQRHADMTIYPDADTSVDAASVLKDLKALKNAHHQSLRRNGGCEQDSDLRGRN